LSAQKHPVIVMLEDDSERMHRFHELLSEEVPAFELLHWATAPS
jgi:hypothetical protein